MIITLQMFANQIFQLILLQFLLNLAFEFDDVQLLLA